MNSKSNDIPIVLCELLYHFGFATVIHDGMVMGFIKDCNKEEN